MDENSYNFEVMVLILDMNEATKFVGSQSINSKMVTEVYITNLNYTEGKMEQLDELVNNSAMANSRLAKFHMAAYDNHSD